MLYSALIIRLERVLPAEQVLEAMLIIVYLVPSGLIVLTTHRHGIDVGVG